MCQFSGKKDNFDIFGPNLPKNGSLSPDSESATPRYQACQFSVKMENLFFFGLNLGNVFNYVRYFGCNNAEDVAESWVEAEMSWVELDGAGWRLK